MPNTTNTMPNTIWRYNKLNGPYMWLLSLELPLYENFPYAYFTLKIVIDKRNTFSQ